MEASRRNILSGDRFNSFFPKATMHTIPVKSNASLTHTLQTIPQVVHSTLWQTQKLASFLKTDTIFSTCKNIWQFVYQHINYQKDEKGREQIRTPARVWNDRKTGVDCDCYSVFISSILSNLKIPHSLRITRYSANHFQHIYPIVHLDNNNYITMDAVVDHYNYEVPYTEKKDIPMELEILNGIDDYEIQDLLDEDFEYLDDEHDLEGFLNGKKRKARRPKRKKKRGRLKKLLGKGLNVINKINPATVALRAGILASMKLNVLKVAQRVKYAYLSESQARAKGIDIPKWRRLVKVKDRIERVYFGAGGKKSKIKKAILTGKGNKKREVPLSGFEPDMAVDHLHENMLLSEVLGPDLFESEFEKDAFDLNGLGELGEPVSAATIAAASGVLAAFAGLIKNIGNIFPKKTKDSGDFELDKASQKEIERAVTSNNISTNEPNSSTERIVSQANNSPNIIQSSSMSNNDSQLGFWEENKQWLKPTLLGIGALGVMYAGFRIVKSNKDEKKTLNGTPKKKRTYKRKNPTQLM